MKKNAFLARVVGFFCKIFQVVAYGLALVMESILRWADGECGGNHSPYDGLEGGKAVPRRRQSPSLTNSLDHSQHHLLH